MIKRITTYTTCLNIITNHKKNVLCKINTINPKKITPNFTFFPWRNFHSSPIFLKKIFLDLENAYAFKILPPLGAPQSLSVTPITSIHDFEKLLDNNWRDSNATEIVQAFGQVKDVCISHKITLSDRRFDKLVDGLMDHCEKLTDEQLLKLLQVLSEYPPCENTYSHNFHDVWSCLDDICCWKMGKWDLEKMFVFANAWFNLNLGKISDYTFEVLDKIPKKAKRLDRKMLLYTYFHINVCRRKSVDFDIEHSLARHIDQFSVDELAVIAMGYFKTQTRIKHKSILLQMMKKVAENRDTIKDISLTAILKAIRLTQNIESVEDLNQMLDSLTNQIPRFSLMTLVHISLVGTGLQLKHEPSLVKCVEIITQNIEKIRLKDLERILLVNSMFNLDSNLYDLAFKEIHQSNRRKEIVQYTRCLPCALNYLSQRNLYSYDLMNEVLNEEFIDEVYGNNAKQIPRELFSLDVCIDIECPGYHGNRLSPRKKYKAAKWLTEFTPTPDQYKKLTLSEKFYLDVVDHVAKYVGGKNYLRSDHVLPHFSKSDIILVRERASGRFVEPFGFENYILGDVKWPLDLDKYEWLAVVILSPNQTIRNQVLPLGALVMKQRQLKKVGYDPVFIYWNEWMSLTTADKQILITARLS